MRNLLRLASILAGLLLLLALPARAASYVDDMTDLNNNNIKSYSGLRAYPHSQQSNNWNALPDRTLLTFSSPASPVGSASYRIQGAETVTVGIYTMTGAFACQVPGSPGRYALGVCGSLSEMKNQQLVQAKFSPSRGAIYARINGSMKKLYHTGSIYEFLDTEESPGDLIGYGVNVSVSADGQSYTPVALTQTDLVFVNGFSFIYEQYTAYIPDGVRHVRVEINDVTQYSVMTGSQESVTAKNAVNLTSLASVAFAGSDMSLGVQEEVSSEPSPVTESSAVPEEKESKENSGKAASKAASSGAGAASSESGSKFEGVITSSSASKSGGTAGTAKKKAAAQNSEIVLEEEPAAAKTEQQESSEPLEYTLSFGGGSGGANPAVIGVTAFIFLVCAAILYWLTKAKK